MADEMVERVARAIYGAHPYNDNDDSPTPGFDGLPPEWIGVHFAMARAAIEAMEKPPKPNPGSEAALDMGCKCPVLDNGHGAGYMGQPGIFVITAGCPVHPLPERFDVVPPPTPSETGEKTE